MRLRDYLPRVLDRGEARERYDYEPSRSEQASETVRIRASSAVSPARSSLPETWILDALVVPAWLAALIAASLGAVQGAMLFVAIIPLLLVLREVR